MKNWKALGASLVLLVFTAGCAQNTGPKEGIGTVLGGIGGAVLGAQFGRGTGQLVGVAAGTLLGAFIGNSIGSSLDKADQTYANQAANRAFETAPSGQAVGWQNPDSGNNGTIVPKPAYQKSNGQYCREFQQSVTVGGKTQSAYGTACRQPDGSWQIVS